MAAALQYCRWIHVVRLLLQRLARACVHAFSSPWGRGGVYRIARIHTVVGCTGDGSVDAV